jgi:hypothetical protein
VSKSRGNLYPNTVADRRSGDTNPKIERPVLEWLDNVLVPVMVREYLAVRARAGDNGEDRIGPSEADTLFPEKMQ